jgi:ribosomal protein L3 glutamine methyltransferase
VSIPEKLQVMTTIRDFVRWGTSEFQRSQLEYGHGFSNGFDEARYLTLHALALPYDWSEHYFDSVLTLDEREKVIQMLQLRASSRKPAAYITQQSWFCGLPFYVDERVLVPRSPIAELIGNGFEPWIDSIGVNNILDLCTGSACIAVAAQYHFPDAKVSASDISADALKVASINLERHDLSDHISLYESDLFDAIPKQAFDVITCNPPYVDAEDMSALSDEFHHEPKLGLAAGQDGLQIVDRILTQVGNYLSDHGVIFVEVGNSQLAMEEKYNFLPMTWIDFEFGGSGVCCIQAQDLKQQQAAITALTPVQSI